ncbi:MAG: hypothetical protein LW817_08165 [Candidatus Caenarcaniphilales bacterium]|jgi:hypothetical protein|nr:hypothetical protein [Candidatus Caenarcaniphilales bacterium]
MKKLLWLLVLFICANAAFAHEGHDHDPVAALFEQKGSKYEISAGDHHIGHFVIKSVRKNRKGAIVRIDQTFHSGDVDEFKTVTADYYKDGILAYKFVGDADTYIVLIDFRNISEGTNSGVRFAYTTETSKRTSTNENIIVEKSLE